MRETDAQRSVASHRKSGDPSRGALRADAIRALDERYELAQKEISVKSLAVPRIDVEGVPSVRRDDQEVASLVIPAQIPQQSPFAGQGHFLLVPSESVQNIQKRISLCSRGRRRII